MVLGWCLQPRPGQSWPLPSPLAGSHTGQGTSRPLPLSHCVCAPCWDTPFKKALGKKWVALPHHPASLTSLFSAPLPVASWE